ncbi:hypothetical protein E5288_WYG000384 [Bos mutus]|uniref:Uncharacterized protein n=1 Tax=Bos mutus TaxID=72004 RepID=A0A6B0QUE4_9CETA|nr:hypothetical protein [Bos mutus]
MPLPLLLLAMVPQPWSSHPLPALWVPPWSGTLLFHRIEPPGDKDCVFTALRGQNMSPDLVLPHLKKSVTHMSQLLSSEGPQERKEIEGLLLATL